jgi:hypothetical protein
MPIRLLLPSFEKLFRRFTPIIKSPFPHDFALKAGIFVFFADEGPLSRTPDRMVK